MQYRDLPKHAHYKSAYRRFDYYWGLGIEHETYLKTTQTKEIQSFEGIMKPERYSVNYYKSYKDETIMESLNKYIKEKNGSIEVPILVNSHSFTHADIYGYHKTTYERSPKPNPQYTGKTMFDWVCEYSNWCKENYGKAFVWDGDTIEFITQNFYKATLKEIMDEIRTTTKQFELELKKLPRHGLLVAYGPLSLAMPTNEPFAFHLTNLRNVSMFNNGTIHINLTLPTRLGWNAQPLCWKLFVRQHKRLARCIQWLEPFFIAAYGSGDPLAQIDDCYAKGSQRLAVSRYIGLGTFDTHTMPTGKILQIDRTGFPWYEKLYKKTNYAHLDKVGLDLNFNKHGAHGLELRFFDQMPYDKLEEVMKRLILLMDYSLQTKKLPNPTKCVLWQSWAEEALLEGTAWQISVESCEYIFKLFGLYKTVLKEPYYIQEFLEILFKNLESFKGKCWNLMI